MFFIKIKISFMCSCDGVWKVFQHMFKSCVLDFFLNL